MIHSAFIRYFLTLIISLALVGLSGCGFQLRGHDNKALAWQNLYLQTEDPYGSLDPSLRQTLRASGIVLVKTPQQAPVTLSLSKPITSNSSASIGPSSQTRIYTLNYRVSFTLINKQGKVLVGPRVLNASRSLTLSANQLLESNNQADILTREMERDIVNQLYNYLRSEQVLEALKQATP